MEKSKDRGRAGGSLTLNVASIRFQGTPALLFSIE
jgi:hypothetical protein